MEQPLSSNIPPWDPSLLLAQQIKAIQYKQTLIGNQLQIQILTPNIPTAIMFNYVLYCGKDKVALSRATTDPHFSFMLPGGGTFHIKFYLLEQNEKVSRHFEPVTFECEQQYIPSKLNSAFLKKDASQKDYFINGKPTYLEVFLPDQYETLLGISDGAYFKGRSQETIDRASQLLDYQLFGYDLTPPCNWKFPPEFGRRLPYRCHSFLWIVDLLTEYWSTGKATYRDRFLEYVFDWIHAHPHIDMRDEWAWHDDATARRVYFFCVTLLLFEKILTPEQIATLKASMKMQATLLCKESFYKRNHNHGMYQDRTLALYGLTFAEEPEYYLLMAKERTREYFYYAFTTDGVHKEHSPMYHMDMASSISWFAMAYRNIDPEFSSELDELLHRMANYIVWITQPDQYIPSIGDSPLRARVSSLWTADPNYQWVVTNGQLGTAPEETGEIFWEAGYGVFRSSWNMNKDKDTWMMLLASTHSMAHKHNDDLSFLLYHKGPLFVEAGNRNYNYTEEKTQYIYSSYGHNVLFVNGEGWKLKPTTHLPLLEPAAFETKIIDGNTQGNIQWVTGRQTRFPGVCQERTLRYRRAINTVELEDRITLEEDSSLRLIFHIAEGVEVQETSTGWVFLRNGKRIARAYVDGNADIRRTTYTGDGVDPWRTWIFNGFPDEKQGTLLAVDMDGTEGENKMCLRVDLY